MSAEEDTELRDLVIQTLENKGVIGKIKAELRASVFLALEEHDGLGNGLKQKNKELHEFLATDKGWTMASLVREFLQYFHLDFTLAVFDPEICAVRGFLSRKHLCEQMKLEEKNIRNIPLLAELVQVVLKPTDKNEEKSQVSDVLSEQESPKNFTQNHIMESKQREEGVEKTKQTEQDEDISFKTDPFYDDLIPEEKNLDFSNFKKDKDISTRRPDSDVSSHTIKNTKPTDEKEKQNFSTLSSLQDLPSLSRKPLGNAEINKNPKSKINQDHNKETSNPDTEFFLNSASHEGSRRKDEDYEDDFYSSLSNHSGKSVQQEIEMKEDSSEHSVEEEIEEDLSALGDDILNSSISYGDDAMTTDHTISQASAVGGYDFIESIT